MSDKSERLKKARIQAGFEKPAEAAAAFGWKYQTYAHNENGSAAFSFEKAVVYSKGFGISAEWLYNGTGPMVPKVLPEDEPVLEIWRKIPKDARPIALKTLRAFEPEPKTMDQWEAERPELFAKVREFAETRRALTGGKEDLSKVMEILSAVLGRTSEPHILDQDPDPKPKPKPQNNHQL